MNLKRTTNYSLLIAATLLFSNCSSAANDANENSDCDVNENLSYTKDILPILEENCLSCHNEENYSKKADGRLFEGYDNFKKYIDKGTVVKAINHETGLVKMPYRKAKLDDCTILKIETWVEEGSKNN